MSYLILDSFQMTQFSQSLAASALFLSNFYFDFKGGYFDPTANALPLLHTWSLAVEEQFYIVAPIALWLLWRFGRPWLLAIFVAAWLLSLIAAELMQGIDRDAAFYLAPFRIWELSLGAVTAIVLSRREAAFSPPVSEVICATGLLMIVASIALIDEGARHPGFITIPVCLGTVMVLVADNAKGPFSSVLRAGPVVGLGLISYSAYLWHQPLLEFLKVVSPEPSTLALIAALASTILIAWISWRYVERPFRKRSSGFSRAFIFLFSGAGIAVFVALGVWGYVQKGFLFELSSSSRTIISYLDYPRRPIYREGTCFLRLDQTATDYTAECADGDVLIYGDSHAAALSSGYRRLLTDIGQLTASSCIPALPDASGVTARCASVSAALLGQLETAPPKILIIHANWRLYGERIELLSGLLANISEIAPETEVRILGSAPLWAPNQISALLRDDIELSPEFADSRVENGLVWLLRQTDDRLEALSNGAKFDRPTELLCKSEMCLAIAELDGVWTPYAWDSAHMTEAGALSLARRLEEGIPGTN